MSRIPANPPRVPWERARGTDRSKKDPNRQPQGVPTGGQFAPSTHPESEVELGGTESGEMECPACESVFPADPDASDRQCHLCAPGYFLVPRRARSEVELGQLSTNADTFFQTSTGHLLCGRHAKEQFRGFGDSVSMWPASAHELADGGHICIDCLGESVWPDNTSSEEKAERARQEIQAEAFRDISALLKENLDWETQPWLGTAQRVKAIVTAADSRLTEPAAKP